MPRAKKPIKSRTNGNGRGARKGKVGYARGIVQGTAAAARPGMMARKRRPRGGPSSIVAMDAFHPAHLGLPRAVGPYVVTRVTQTFDMPNTTPSSVYMFGTSRIKAVQNAVAIVANDPVFPFAREDLGVTPWLANFVWYQSTNVLPVYTELKTAMFESLVNNAQVVAGFPAVSDISEGYNGSTVVPSAFSIRLMNAEALQTSTGIVYVGRLKTQLRLANAGGGGNFPTLESLKSNFVSFNAPRLCSAGKLALRGVKVDAVPYNMNALADFAPISGYPTTLTGGQPIGYSAATFDMTGFAPIIVCPEGVSLKALVCMELRTRFGPSNPAQAAHRMHPTPSDAHWAKLQADMHSAGHGVLDIVETVAAWGQRAATIYKGLSALAG